MGQGFDQNHFQVRNSGNYYIYKYPTANLNKHIIHHTFAKYGIHLSKYKFNGDTFPYLSNRKHYSNTRTIMSNIFRQPSVKKSSRILRYWAMYINHRKIFSVPISLDDFISFGGHLEKTYCHTMVIGFGDKIIHKAFTLILPLFKVKPISHDFQFSLVIAFWGSSRFSLTQNPFSSTWNYYI